MHALRKHDFTILLTLYFFLLPIGNTLWYLLFIMACIGSVLFYREWRAGSLGAGTKWLIGLGACIWIPALLSTPTSIDVGRSMVFVGAYPLFFLASYFLYQRLKSGINPWPAICAITAIVIM